MTSLKSIAIALSAILLIGGGGFLVYHFATKSGQSNQTTAQTDEEARLKAMAAAHFEALKEAFAKGDFAAVQMMLFSNPDLLSMEYMGKDVAAWAIGTGDERLAKMLLAAGSAGFEQELVNQASIAGNPVLASALATMSQDKQALINAYKAGDKDALAAILKKHPELAGAMTNGKSLAAMAAESGKTDMLEAIAAHARQDTLTALSSFAQSSGNPGLGRTTAKEQGKRDAFAAAYKAGDAQKMKALLKESPGMAGDMVDGKTAEQQVAEKEAEEQLAMAGKDNKRGPGEEDGKKGEDDPESGLEINIETREEDLKENEAKKVAVDDGGDGTGKAGGTGKADGKGKDGDGKGDGRTGKADEGDLGLKDPDAKGDDDDDDDAEVDIEKRKEDPEDSDVNQPTLDDGGGGTGDGTGGDGTGGDGTGGDGSGNDGTGGSGGGDGGKGDNGDDLQPKIDDDGRKDGTDDDGGDDDDGDDDTGWGDDDDGTGGGSGSEGGSGGGGSGGGGSGGGGSGGDGSGGGTGGTGGTGGGGSGSGGDGSGSGSGGSGSGGSGGSGSGGSGSGGSGGSGGAGGVSFDDGGEEKNYFYWEDQQQSSKKWLRIRTGIGRQHYIHFDDPEDGQHRIVIKKTGTDPNGNNSETTIGRITTDEGTVRYKEFHDRWSYIPAYDDGWSKGQANSAQNKFRNDLDEEIDADEPQDEDEDVDGGKKEGISYVHEFSLKKFENVDTNVICLETWKFVGGNLSQVKYVFWATSYLGYFFCENGCQAQRTYVFVFIPDWGGRAYTKAQSKQYWGKIPNDVFFQQKVWDTVLSLDSTRKSNHPDGHKDDSKYEKGAGPKMKDWPSGGGRTPTVSNGPLAGGTGGGAWTDKGGTYERLTGFAFNVGKWGDHNLLRSIQARIRRENGTYYWKSRRGGYSTTHSVHAASGYVVGGIKVRSGSYVNGFKVIFMRMNENTLNPNDKYESPWYGYAGTNEATLGNDGKPAIGIHGRSGAIIDALGLVQTSD